jgi:hypothetical protein
MGGKIYKTLAKQSREEFYCAATFGNYRSRLLWSAGKQPTSESKKKCGRE